MAQIPLAPLEQKEASRPEPRYPGRLTRAARYMASPLGLWAGSRSIRGTASFIGATLQDAGVTKRDARFRLFSNGDFDLEASARSFGISVPELEGRLAFRRRQSAYVAYLCLV